MARITYTKSVDRTWISVVTSADPEFENEKRRELEYKFSNGREFRGEQHKRGQYAEED
jgi:hypothetical protein